MIKKFDELTEEQQEYVKRYVRKTGNTIESALRMRVVRDVLEELEHGNKEREIFA